MSVFRILLLSVVMLGQAFSMAWAGGSASMFDKPLHETHTPLPRDPHNPQFKPMLFCFYYPNFMVKQVDLGEKGAEQLSILPYWMKDNKEPPCLRANATDEMVIDPRAWSGYFEGVKGDFVFFVSADGSDGGSGFAVFNAVNALEVFADTAKLTKDSTGFISMVVLNYPKNDSDSALQLHYRRVYVAPCSLRSDEKNCWGFVRQITGLTEVSPPNCAAAYQAKEKEDPKNAKDYEAFLSVITYEVEAVLNSGYALRVTPASKATECYPAE